ncbi:hypothetical protein NIES4071_46060 [Calothrix sp. NIES-4071]|nr:hypothetical protein NIES4071_46060 [Calothrix sp. NIES-4071]BAZ58918.1 hypothetical protein NIES4105_45990 [Calothrix sp. NIES-4105]
MSSGSRKQRILNPNQSYTFRSYFDMRFPIADILWELGVNFKKSNINFPQGSTTEPNRLSSLRQRLEEAVFRVNLTSESARQQVLIAPIVLELAHFTESIVNIEYPIEVNQYLKGDLDYYIQSSNHVLVVEAKQADLTRGFTQLAVELIALDGWIDNNEPVLYGTVTTGDIWQFGSFTRETKTISQHLMLYRVPTDLEILFNILVSILKPS